MPNITIGVNDFIRGVSTSDDLPDGGYSPDDKGQNLLSNPGTLNQGTQISQLDTNIVGEIFGAEDGESSNLLYFIGNASNEDGKFYMWDAIGNQPTLKQSDTTGANYNSFYSDTCWYENRFYVTSHNEIAHLNADGTTLTTGFWQTNAGTALLSSATNPIRHPLLVFDDKMFIGNGTQIDYWDGTNAVEDVVTIPDNEKIRIMDLRQDPATGDMLIAVMANTNQTGGKHRGKIYVWDGFSPVPNREIIVNGFITAFHSFGGVMYVFYDNYIGYWNGNGIIPIRRLDLTRTTIPTTFDADAGGDDPDNYIWTAKVSDDGETMLIGDGENILAYGRVLAGGKKIWYYPSKSIDGTIGLLHHIGDSKFAIADKDGANTNFGYINMLTSTPAQPTNWLSNKYFLPTNSRIKKVEVLTSPLVTGDTVSFKLRKSSAPTTDIAIGSMSTNGQSQATFKEFNIETSSVQIRITNSGGNSAVQIKQIKIYYEPTEKEV